jgi:hypothetical protein
MLSLIKNTLGFSEFLAMFSTRLFCKFYLPWIIILMKKLNKFWRETIIPATVAYGVICIFHLFLKLIVYSASVHQN